MSITLEAAGTVAEALSALGSASERVYYEAEADAAAAAAYYADTGPADWAVLVAETHRTQPRYRPTVEVYPWVDLQPDRSLQSLYTAHRWDPQALIEDDAVVEQLRAAALGRLSVVARVGIAPLAGAASGSVDIDAMVEAVLPFNCEHVVPQSWFGHAEPMRGDLHHLFACESRCNSFRGNTPYQEFLDFPAPRPSPDADVPAVVEAIRDDCGKIEAEGFEPTRGKGAAARAVCYVALRYPGVLDRMPADRWPVVLAWHAQDPVSEWERHRNAAIAERQGNRNPFVDHPDLAVDLLAQLGIVLGAAPVGPP